MVVGNFVLIFLLNRIQNYSLSRMEPWSLSCVKTMKMMRRSTNNWIKCESAFSLPFPSSNLLTLYALFTNDTNTFYFHLDKILV